MRLICSIVCWYLEAHVRYFEQFPEAAEAGYNWTFVA